MNKKLRIGLLLDDFDQPAWAYETLSAINAGDYASIELIVLNDTDKPVRAGILQRIRNNKGEITKSLIKKVLVKVREVLDNRPSESRDAFETHDVRRFLADIPVIRTKPLQKKYSDFIVEKDIERILGHEIDVFIRLGFRILRGAVLTSARYGIWSYHHGDNRVNRGGPAGLWESLEKWPTTGSILQILSEDLDSGQVLYRSWSNTVTRSPLENANNYFWKTALFLPRKLKELHRVGEQDFFERVAAQNALPEIYSRRLYLEPTNWEYFKLLGKNILGKVWQKLAVRLYFDQWILLYSFEDDVSSSLWRYKRIIPPNDRFWADPHPIKRDGRFFVFFEELVYAEGKGHICVLEIAPDGTVGPPQKVLEEPFHMSYPLLVESDHRLFMIPETGEDKTIKLYECEEFPDRWAFRKNLMENVSAYDATVFFRDGRWWLFATMVEIEGSSTDDELFLFYSDSLDSDDWTPHPLNPIVSDVRNARPAGPLFERNGKLFRPAQNCAKRYGYGFNLNLIEELNELDFRETPVCQVTPEWSDDVVATHSFCHIDGLTLTDAQIRRSTFGS